VTSNRIIVLLLILSLFAGIITPILPLVYHADDISALAGSLDGSTSKKSGLYAFDQSIAWDNAILLKVGNRLPAPVTFIALFWLTSLVVVYKGWRYGDRRIGASPPFLASERQHTYLLNSVLLI
jgi:hypothetical protein